MRERGREREVSENELLSPFCLEWSVMMSQLLGFRQCGLALEVLFLLPLLLLLLLLSVSARK